jgi:hypothetical protein
VPFVPLLNWNHLRGVLPFAIGLPFQQHEFYAAIGQVPVSAEPSDPDPATSGSRSYFTRISLDLHKGTAPTKKGWEYCTARIKEKRTHRKAINTLKVFNGLLKHLDRTS